MSVTSVGAAEVPKWSPFSRTLNLDFLEVDETASMVRMRSCPSNRLAETRQLDPRCIVGLVDHAMGYTLQGHYDVMLPSATLNLRLDFQSYAALEDDLVVRCRIRSRHSSAVLLTAEVETASGVVVALGTGFFTQRYFPGKVDLQDFVLTDYRPSTDVHCYAQAIDLQCNDVGWSLQAGCMGSVGWEPGNTFHGGAVGSLLMACVEEAVAREDGDKRIVSFDITYLRPSSADRPLLARCTPRRLGGYASFYVVECYQDSPDKPVAKAEFCCLAQ